MLLLLPSQLPQSGSTCSLLRRQKQQAQLSG
jgi:hypothetical protein